MTNSLVDFHTGADLGQLRASNRTEVGLLVGRSTTNHDADS